MIKEVRRYFYRSMDMIRTILIDRNGKESLKASKLVDKINGTTFGPYQVLSREVI